MTQSNPPKPLRALLLEGIHPGAREVLAAAGVEVELVAGSPKREELDRLLSGADILGIRSKTHLTRELLDKHSHLVVVGAFCIGTNQIDVEAATAHGIPVFNAPFSNTRSVAELIIAEVVALSRQLGDRSREVHEGRWQKRAVGCHEIRGRTLGIVGYGHIGSQVGVLAEAMGMRVVFFDIVTKLPMGNNRSAPSLEALLAESDFVTLHVPGTPQTERMIGSAELAKMKPGAYLLNASRGTVVDIPALASALKTGHVAGAAVDVYPEEPEANGEGFKSDLCGLSNVILTPHIGGSTEEAQASIGREVAESIARFVTKGATTMSVNFPQVELPLSPGKHRVVNVHKNVPGVLGSINHIVSEANANIFGQVLATSPDIGYLVMDLDEHVSGSVRDRIAELPTSIRTRVLSG